MSLQSMSLLRNTNLSIYYAMCEQMSSRVTQENLDRVSDTTFKAKNANWVDTMIPKVYIYDKEQTFGYTIDFKNGLVIFDMSQTSDSIICDYSYKLIDIYDDYPDIDSPDFRVPAISILHDFTDETPFQLTHGYELSRFYVIDVFASRSGQRDDIAEHIVNMFDTEIPIIDFNKGFPMLPNGEINKKFSKTQQIIGFLEKDSIKMTPERSISKGLVERYVMSIDVCLVAYKNI